MAKTFEHIGVWMNREDLLERQPGHLERVMDDLAGIGVTHLYPEVYFRGGAAYPSGVAPIHGEFRIVRGGGEAGRPDLLARLVELAHARSIEVHPWVWVFCAGYWHAFGPVLQVHPDWAELDQDHQPFSNWRYGTAWLCPALPQVRSYLLAVLEELVTRWAVDGLHLDYIRYNEEEVGSFGFHPSSLDAFRRDSGGGPDLATAAGRAAWTAWRSLQVTSFVQDVNRRLHQLRPQLQLSAAVVPDPDQSYYNACQQWGDWIKQGLLHHVLPMAYRTDVEELRAVLRQMREKLPPSRVYPGLAVWVPPDGIVQLVDLVREEGFAGVTLFSTLNLTEAHYKALRTTLG